MADSSSSWGYSSRWLHSVSARCQTRRCTHPAGWSVSRGCYLRAAVLFSSHRRTESRVSPRVSSWLVCPPSVRGLRCSARLSTLAAGRRCFHGLRKSSSRGSCLAWWPFSARPFPPTLYAEHSVDTRRGAGPAASRPSGSAARGCRRYGWNDRRRTGHRNVYPLPVGSRTVVGGTRRPVATPTPVGVRVGCVRYDSLGRLRHLPVAAGRSHCPHQTVSSPRCDGHPGYSDHHGRQGAAPRTACASGGSLDRQYVSRHAACLLARRLVGEQQLLSVIDAPHERHLRPDYQPARS